MKLSQTLRQVNLLLTIIDLLCNSIFSCGEGVKQFPVFPVLFIFSRNILLRRWILNSLITPLSLLSLFSMIHQDHTNVTLYKNVDFCLEKILPEK